jgi:hypothetical protein
VAGVFVIRDFCSGDSNFTQARRRLRERITEAGDGDRSVGRASRFGSLSGFGAARAGFPANARAPAHPSHSSFQVFKSQIVPPAAL